MATEIEIDTGIDDFLFLQDPSVLIYIILFELFD